MKRLRDSIPNKETPIYITYEATSAAKNRKFAEELYSEIIKKGYTNVLLQDKTNYISWGYPERDVLIIRGSAGDCKLFVTVY